jgi:gas vesicle protein
VKEKKMPFIVKEMNFSGNEYVINGIDLTEAQFYIKKNRELFKIVAPGDYEIITKGSNTYLSITNSAILTDVVSVQVIDYLIMSSGRYETGSDPDINILVENYNKLIEDFKSLWAYVQKQVFVSDTSIMPLVFPLLGEGETWVFKDGEMRAVLLYDAVEELRKAVEQVRDEIKTELENKINEFTTNITNLISEFRTEIQNIINTGKSDINTIIENFENDFTTLVSSSKTEIINLTNEQKTSITDLTNNSKTEIVNTTNTQITNITNIVNNGKTELTEITEEKKDEIRNLAEEILGFDPDNYYTKPEIDTMLSDVTETIETIFVGNAELFNGDFVDCTIPRVLENINKGEILITFGDVQFDWFVLTFPVLALTEDYGFYIPSTVYQGSTLLFLKVVRQGNDLYFTSINYTGISQISVKKIRYLK